MKLLLTNCRRANYNTKNFQTNLNNYPHRIAMRKNLKEHMNSD